MSDGVHTRDVTASPLARAEADRYGLDLAAVTGSGPRGRIVAADVHRLLEARDPVAARRHHRGADWGGSVRTRVVGSLHQQQHGHVLYRSATADISSVHRAWRQDRSEVDFTIYLAGAIAACLVNESWHERLRADGVGNLGSRPRVGIMVSTRSGPVVGNLDIAGPTSWDDAAEEVASLTGRIESRRVRTRDLARPAMVLHVDPGRNELENPILFAAPAPTLWAGNQRWSSDRSGSEAGSGLQATMRLAFDLAETRDGLASESLDAIVDALGRATDTTVADAEA